MHCHWSTEVQESGEAHLGMLVVGLIKHIWRLKRLSHKEYENILTCIASIVPRTSQNHSLPPDDLVLHDLLCRFLLSLRWSFVGFTPKSTPLDLMPVLGCDCSVCNHVNMWLSDSEKLTFEVGATAAKVGYLHMCLWSYYARGFLSQSISIDYRPGRAFQRKVLCTKNPAKLAYDKRAQPAVELIRAHEDIIEDVLTPSSYSILIEREFSPSNIKENSELRNSGFSSVEERLEALVEEPGLPPTKEILDHSNGSLRAYLLSWYEASSPDLKSNHGNTKRCASSDFEMPSEKKAASE